MKKILCHVYAISMIMLPLLAFGQDIGLKNPVKVNSIAELILIVTRVVRYIAIPFVVVAIMYSGFLYIWDTVNSKGTKRAWETTKYTLIGTFILLSAELIALVMRNTIEGLTN